MSLKQTLKVAKQLEKKTIKDAGSNNNIANLNVLKNATKPRNYLIFNPLLKKGGVHEKHNVEAVHKKKRRETRQSLRQTDWLSEI